MDFRKIHSPLFWIMQKIRLNYRTFFYIYMFNAFIILNTKNAKITCECKVRCIKLQWILPIQSPKVSKLNLCVYTCVFQKFHIPLPISKIRKTRVYSHESHFQMIFHFVENLQEKAPYSIHFEISYRKGVLKQIFGRLQSRQT